MSGAAAAQTTAARGASGTPQCFVARRIVLEGLPAALAFVQADVDALRGACLTAKTVDAIAARATRSFVEHGYVTTRVVVPEQDISRGTFRLTVVVGRIRHIAFANSSPATWKNAFPIRSGQILNVRDLDEGLEQMKRVPADDVTMQIVPALVPGESDVLIAVRHTSPVQAAIDVNNAGTTQTGVYQGSLNVAYDNLFHANDILSVTLNSPAQLGVVSGNRGNTASFSIPDGYWTYALTTSKYDYAQNVAGYDGSYTLSGTQHHFEFDATKTLLRTASATTGIEMRIAADASRSFVDGTEIDVQHTNASYGELDLVHAGPLGGGRFNVSVGVRNGIPLFGTLPDAQGVAHPPTNFYRMALLDLTAGVPLRYSGVTFVWRPAFHGQATPDEIALAQQFSIGNRYTVRGFDGSSTLIAESGYTFRNDLELALKHGNAVYLGFDTGCVWGPSAAFLAGHSLTGFAVGLRGNGRHINYDASLGFAVSAPIGFTTAEPAAAIDVSFHT